MRPFLATFDVTTEVVCMVLCLAMFMIIWMSKPAKSRLLYINVSGFGMAFVTMSLHISMLSETLKMRETGDMSLFHLKYLLFSLCYVAVLDLIYAYMYFLPYRKKRARYIVWINIFFNSLVYLLILAQPVIRLQRAVKRGENIVMGAGIDNYVFCSLLCVFFSAIVVIVNRKILTKVVFWGTTLFVPVLAIVVAMQFFFQSSYFICATYTLPFVLYYILFHAAIYDPTMGCQDLNSETDILQKYISRNKNFIRIQVHFPKLENHDYTDIKDDVAYAGNVICRKAEMLSVSTRIYRTSDYDFSLIARTRSKNHYNKYLMRFMDALGEMNNYSNKKASLHAKVLVMRNMEGLDNAADYYLLSKLVSKRFDNFDVDEVISVSEEDVEKYNRNSTVERALWDITGTGNLDDERVLLFIQPIFNIKHNEFKTGEALMRLNIDGKIYYPDSFIPVAENMGSIHTLTRIILHKAAKKTVELAQNPAFDAISVNVSTIEMGNPDIADEFEKIILDAGANPKHIRLEITESTTISNYDVIIDNMNKLRSKGIYFYLDDFGTGFSNLDRIVGMPFRTIKFDKSLLYKALSDSNSKLLFEMLVNFCKLNKLSIVVEGVENEAQRDYVAETGFDYIQGYYYSKPIPESECDSFYINK